MQDGRERDRCASRCCAERAPRERAASGVATCAGSRAAAHPAFHLAAATPGDPDHLRWRCGALVQQRAAGSRAHPRVPGSASQGVVACVLPCRRPRQCELIGRRRGRPRPGSEGRGAGVRRTKSRGGASRRPLSGLRLRVAVRSLRALRAPHETPCAYPRWCACAGHSSHPFLP